MSSLILPLVQFVSLHATDERQEMSICEFKEARVGASLISGENPEGIQTECIKSKDRNEKENKSIGPNMIQQWGALNITIGLWVWWFTAWSLRELGIIITYYLGPVDFLALLGKLSLLELSIT
jgi:hypothetical protein